MEVLRLPFNLKFFQHLRESYKYTFYTEQNQGFTLSPTKRFLFLVRAYTISVSFETWLIRLPARCRRHRPSS